jgi:hypothetical protein
MGSGTDQKLLTLLKAANVNGVQDVITTMRGIDGVLPEEDGLKWFNALYLMVTCGVEEQSRNGNWQDAAWLNRLDVVFAKLYFAAIVSCGVQDGLTPKSWNALFEARKCRGIDRIQYALAGMNAHINHDLAIALERMAAPDGRFPMRDGARHRDFQHVNDILERAETTMRAQLATGLVAEIDRELGDLDSVAALWKVRKAREAAWTNGEVLWQLRGLPRLRNEFAERLDRMTELAGQGLLLPRLG